MVTGTRAANSTNDASAVSRADTVDIPFLRRLVTSPQFALIVLIVLFGFFVWTEAPQVASAINLINILRNTTFIFIIGCFTTLVLVSGGLDLSIGSVYLVGAMATAALLDNGVPIPLSILLGVAAGGFAGFVNGVLINYVNIPAFIATLSMLYIARGVVVFLTKSFPSPLFPTPSTSSVRARSSASPIFSSTPWSSVSSSTCSWSTPFSAPRSAPSAAIARRPRTWESTSAGSRSSSTP